MIYVGFNQLDCFFNVFLGFVEMLVKTFFNFRMRRNKELERRKNDQMDKRKPEVDNWIILHCFYYPIKLKGHKCLLKYLKGIIYRQTKKPFVLRILYNMGKKPTDGKVLIDLFSLLHLKRHSQHSSCIDRRSMTKSRPKTQPPKSQIWLVSSARNGITLTKPPSPDSKLSIKQIKLRLPRKKKSMRVSTAKFKEKRKPPKQKNRNECDLP